MNSFNGIACQVNKVIKNKKKNSFIQSVSCRLFHLHSFFKHFSFHPINNNELKKKKLYSKKYSYGHLYHFNSVDLTRFSIIDGKSGYENKQQQRKKETIQFLVIALINSHLWYLESESELLARVQTRAQSQRCTPLHQNKMHQF